jgi:hypothetical protein
VDIACRAKPAVCTAQSAGGPFTLRATNYGQSAVVNDVYVGSVWLLSGQSNIVLSLGDMLIGRSEPWHTLAQRQLDALYRAPLPDVRIYQVQRMYGSCCWDVICMLAYWAPG